MLGMAGSKIWVRSLAWYFLSSTLREGRSRDFETEITSRRMSGSAWADQTPIGACPKPGPKPLSEIMATLLRCRSLGSRSMKYRTPPGVP